MTTKFIAHRGLSGNFPENTHVAFNAAWAADCDGIELDIQVTKDAKVIAFHDADTSRMTGENHVVKDTNWADLQDLDIGQGGKGGSDRFCEQIPLLSDVITRMPSGKIIQIEIKQQIENIAAVIAELSAIREDITVQIISFDSDKLLQVKEEHPNLNYFLVVDEHEPKIDDPIAFAIQHGLTGLDMHYPLITTEFAKKMQEKQLQMACWTVNDDEVAQSLVEKNVMFIAGDYADKLSREP